MIDRPRVGMVVKLNSGGPLMTVITVDGMELCCRWYNAHQEVCDFYYHVSILTEVPANHPFRGDLK